MWNVNFPKSIQPRAIHFIFWGAYVISVKNRGLLRLLHGVKFMNKRQSEESTMEQGFATIVFASIIPVPETFQPPVSSEVLLPKKEGRENFGFISF